MNVNLNPKPVNFKFGEYINKGFELMKAKFGDIFVGLLVTVLMSIIPLCGMMAIGNYYKYIKKLSKNQPTSAGEIFDFKDFMSYLVLQLIIIGAVMLIYIPMVLIMGITGFFVHQHGTEPNPKTVFFMFPYMFLVIITFYYFALRAFYMVPLISLKGVTDIKTAWQISSKMTKGNMLTILLFAIVTSILSQIGILACGIGVLITMPFMYAANYFAYEDGLQQIEYDEIKEIGSAKQF